MVEMREQQVGIQTDNFKNRRQHLGSVSSFREMKEVARCSPVRDDSVNGSSQFYQ